MFFINAQHIIQGVVKQRLAFCAKFFQFGLRKNEKISVLNEQRDIVLIESEGKEKGSRTCGKNSKKFPTVNEAIFFFVKVESVIMGQKHGLI